MPHLSSQNGKNLSHKSKIKIQDLQRSTSQGFQVHSSLKELHDFFTHDPESVPYAFEPPLFHRKPTRQDLSHSKGLH
jgi:hypothetical protein